MSTELLSVAIAFCVLVAGVVGFILNLFRTSLNSLWSQHNDEKQRTSDFREHVKADFMRKTDLEDHVSLRLDSINDRMERVEAQLEQLQPTMSGLNHSLPGLVKVISRVENILEKTS